MHYKYGAVKSGDKDIDAEKELISRVQQYDDRMAMKQLIAGYSGLLRRCVESSGLKNNMDMSTAMNYAEKYAKDAIRSYNESKGTQPNTHVFGVVTNKLKSVKEATNERSSHMAGDLSRDNGYIGTADTWLDRLNIEPTTENELHFIKNEMGVGGEKLDAKKINRAKALSRVERSGDFVLGGSDSDAETVTYDEMFGQASTMPGTDIFAEYQHKQEIKAALESPEFSRPERVFLRKVLGIDDIGNTQTPKKHQAALNAGLSDAQANQAIAKLKTKLHSKV